MSFENPIVLVALLAIPALIWWYSGQQHRRARAAEAFVQPKLGPSVAPERPRWRRHAPMIAFGIALAVLILAAARPQWSSAEPVTNGAVILADDSSSSMQATDVSPSRERAARDAGARFISGVPSTIQVGVMEFSRTPITLQSPTSDHAAALNALERPVHFGGGTAIGETIETAANTIHNLPLVAGKHRPGAIVLISDGASNVGVGALKAARDAAAMHIPVYTVSIGTPNGVIKITRGKHTVNAPVPVERQQLADIARVSGGQAFVASNAAGVSAAYKRLAARLGHKVVKHEITADFAGGALVLLVLGGALSLFWFGRLA